MEEQNKQKIIYIKKTYDLVEPLKKPKCYIETLKQEYLICNLQ
jgi:hypothetical protein